MDRNYHRKHIPYCGTRVAQCDQYSWPEKDHTEQRCENGVSHPIYNCQGDISYTLPLSLYPKVTEVHPQIEMSKQPHFMVRDPYMERYVERASRDLYEKRLEGFYYYGD
jgi:hypothetical protein